MPRQGLQNGFHFWFHFVRDIRVNEALTFWQSRTRSRDIPTLTFSRSPLASTPDYEVWLSDTISLNRNVPGLPPTRVGMLDPDHMAAYSGWHRL
jgi:hypothetical protein